MKKKLFSMLFFSLVLVLAACGSGDEGDNADGDNAGGEGAQIQLGTGSTGGTYYPLGQEIANILTDNVDVEGFSASAISTDASIDNLSRIGRGELELGMTVHIPAQEAAAGTGSFDGTAIENFGFMGHIYPEVMQVFTLESTGIESIADLKGKRVAIGPPGSGTQAAAKKILEAYGLEEGDYTAFQEGFGDAKKKLQDGQVDASFGFLGLPSSSVDELQAATGEVKLLEITGEPLEKLQAETGYEAFEIPAGSWEWLEEPVNTITAYAILVGSTDLIDEDLGYQITKALFENAGNISHKQGAHITKENALRGSTDLPMHPGAEKYFKEIGLLD
ncbi:MAG: TAXI family TRAP transporter solute-binding subunit [Bacillaceae bacterium]|nr:TAXI family TRAP transporter solute-binding subunit [Bacillaceae bacterium]